MKKSYLVKAAMAAFMCCGLLATSCVEDPGPDNGKDKTITATSVSANIAYTPLTAETAEYRLSISTASMDADGKFTSAGNYVVLSMISGLSADATKPRPEKGIYHLDVNINKWSIFKDLSTFQIVDKSGDSFAAGKKIGITKAIATVDHKAGDDFSVKVLLTLADGSKFDISSENFKQEIEEEEGDILKATYGIIECEKDSKMYYISATTAKVDISATSPLSEGHLLELIIISDPATDPMTSRPAEGKYTWADGDEKFTILKDECQYSPIEKVGNTFVQGEEQPILSATVQISHTGADGFKALMEATLINGKTIKILCESFMRGEDSGGEENPEYEAATISVFTHIDLSDIAVYMLEPLTATLNENGDLTSEGHALELAIVSDKADDPMNCRPAEGLYNIASDYSKFSILKDFSSYTPIIQANGNYQVGTTQQIKDAVVEINHVGEMNFEAIYIITLEDDSVVKVQSNSFINITEPEDPDASDSDQTTLTGDYALNITTPNGMGAFLGDLGKNGTGVWFVSIGDDATGDKFTMQLICGSSTSTDVPVGTYTVGTNIVANTLYPGEVDLTEGSIYGSCYINNTGEYTDYAAVVGGSATITKVGENHKIVVDVLDALNHKITTEWTGPVIVTDESATPAAKATNSIKDKAQKLKHKYVTQKQYVKLSNYLNRK